MCDDCGGSTCAGADGFCANDGCIGYGSFTCKDGSGSCLRSLCETTVPPSMVDPTLTPTHSTLTTEETVNYQSLGEGLCQNVDQEQIGMSYHHDQGSECKIFCTNRPDCGGYAVSTSNNCLLFIAPSAHIVGGGHSWGEAECMVKTGLEPSVMPSEETLVPSTSFPTLMPVTSAPAANPSTAEPTASPSLHPSSSFPTPMPATSAPSGVPSILPSASPSLNPSTDPTTSPFSKPSTLPTIQSSVMPTKSPSINVESSTFQEELLEVQVFSSSEHLTNEMRLKINASSTEPSTLSWFINGEPIANFPSIKSFGNELVILGSDDFELGSMIEVTATATSNADATQSASASFMLAVNVPPSSGECVLDGAADASSLSAFEDVTIRCGNWEDSHPPLTYDFILLTPKRRLTLSQHQPSSDFTLTSPPGEFTIVAKIRDSLGATALFPIEMSSTLPSNLTLVQAGLESSQRNLEDASQSGDLSSFAMNVALIDLTLEVISDASSRRRLIDGVDFRSDMYLAFQDLAQQISGDGNLAQLSQILNSIFSNDREVSPNLLPQAIDSVDDIRFKSNVLVRDSADPLLEVLNTLASSIFQDIQAHNISDLAQSLEESIHNTFRDAIREYISGESYQFDLDSMSGTALKMTSDNEESLQSCGGELFDLPASFSSAFSGEAFDCITVKQDNSPEMLIATPDVQLSDPVSLTLYQASEALKIPQDQFQCDGFVIRHAISNSTDVTPLDEIIGGSVSDGSTFLLPRCAFFDVEQQIWSSENCTLLEYNENQMVCQCSHLTTFMGVLESFEPEINSLEEETWKEFTLQNIFARPTPLILCISVVLSITLLYYMIGEKTNRPLIASKECLPKERRSQLFEKSPEGVVHRLWNEESNACAKVWAMFKLKLRNDHIFFSMWTRHSFTNYSTKFRLLFFMVYLFTILLGSAIFYGQDQHHAVSELFWIIVVAIVGGRLVWIMEFAIKKSRPQFPVEELIKKDISFIENNGSSMGSSMDALHSSSEYFQYSNTPKTIKHKFASQSFEDMLSESLDALIVEGKVRLDTHHPSTLSPRQEESGVDLLEGGAMVAGPRDVSSGTMRKAVSNRSDNSEFAEPLMRQQTSARDASVALPISPRFGPSDLSISVSELIRTRVFTTDYSEFDENIPVTSTHDILDSPAGRGAESTRYLSTLQESLEKLDTFKDFGALMAANTDTVEKRLRKHYHVRQTILQEKYPFANHWRFRVVVFCLTYCLVASLFIMLFGLQFELDSTQLVGSQCGTPSVEETINEAASVHWTQDSKMWPSYALPSTWSTTTRWLFSNMLAVLETLLIINPLRMLLSSLLRVFLFDPFVAFLALLERCGFLCLCCCFRFSDAWTAVKQLDRQDSESSESSKSTPHSRSQTVRLLEKDPVTRFFTSYSMDEMRHSSSIELTVIE